tara:strand:+ start:3224 stop:3448 length:225 start_codon:yes stop_codon:yes gene_type:complete
MEMLTWDKIAPALILTGIGWISMEMSVVKTDLAVLTVQLENVEEKIAANHEMITPMWEDFLLEKSDDYAAWNND